MRLNILHLRGLLGGGSSGPGGEGRIPRRGGRSRRERCLWCRSSRARRVRAEGGQIAGEGRQAYWGPAEAGEEATLWWGGGQIGSLSPARSAACCGTCVEVSSLSILLPCHCVTSPVCLSGLTYLMGRGAGKLVLLP